ncbi:hypothetical protein GW17_00009433, partial [Ensete ventricosum]
SEPMGDHLALVVDDLLARPTLEAAAGNRKHAYVDVDTNTTSSSADPAASAKLKECRICHEEDQDSNMEIPCSSLVQPERRYDVRDMPPGHSHACRRILPLVAFNNVHKIAPEFSVLVFSNSIQVIPLCQSCTIAGVLPWTLGSSYVAC